MPTWQNLAFIKGSGSQHSFGHLQCRRAISTPLFLRELRGQLMHGALHTRSVSKFAFFLHAVFLLNAGCATDRGSAGTLASRSFSICELPHGWPPNGEGKIVIEADYVADGIEKSLLFSSKCPGMTAELYDDRDVVRNDKYTLFDDITQEMLSRTRPLKMRLKLYGTFTGMADGTQHFSVLRYLNVERL